MGGSFEIRPQQAAMIDAAAKAMASRARLLVEAGTGVGKSFAYLIPAIRRIIEHHEVVVVATNTIALQEQLMSKDIPLLREVFRREDGTEPFRAELVKGRGNYLSLRRLTMASQRQDRLFPDEATLRTLHVIEDWARTTIDGTLSTLPPLERPGVWERANSDSGNCMGRRCPTYEKCFYQQSRRRMEQADLLICNHALYFSDLALRANDAGFLPRHHHVILDEAHNVEDTASEHFGVSLAEGRVRHLLSSLAAPGRKKGFLAGLRVPGDSGSLVDRALRLTLDAGREAEAFFDRLVERTGRRPGTARLGAPGAVENTITPVFRELSLALKRLKDAAEDEEEKFELNAYAQRAESIAAQAEILVSQALEGCVYWVECAAHESWGLRATLSCSPIEVGPILKKHLFHGEQSVILTSATLTTGRAGAPDEADEEGAADFDAVDDGGGAAARASRRPARRGVTGGRKSRPSFTHAKSRLGCDDAAELALGSPFDHASLVELHVDASMPDPRDAGYEAELAARIRRHVLATDGGAFVLFTSFATMHRVAALLRDSFAEAGLPVWVQGQDGSRAQILEAFRAGDRGVLFGTSSFWQGVDVRGRGLRNVVITRLPFDPPDRPLTQARLELIESRGGNPFMEDSLPRAVIRFKQGFGRLVRSATDSGRVVVLDPRIIRARYGRAFLDALPEGVRVVESAPGGGAV